MTRPEINAEVIAPGQCCAYEVHPCRGLQGACPNALVRDPALVGQIESAVQASAWSQRHPGRNGKAVPHHLRLRVALAACPNACTMPQIRDIGMIATVTPTAIRPECDGCGCCERTCREGAMRVQDGRAALQVDRCVGCGQCIKICPRHAIEPGPVRLRILVGGRMGRHPRWAQDLCAVEAASAAEVVKAFLDGVAREARPTETMADVVARVTLERLRQEVSVAVRASSTECMKSREPPCPVSSLP